MNAYNKACICHSGKGMMRTKTWHSKPTIVYTVKLLERLTKPMGVVLG